MSESLGVAIIAYNSAKTIKDCIRSFADHVDQIVVVLAGKSTDGTAKIAKKASPKVEIYEMPPIPEPQWVRDVLGTWQGTSNFAAARNLSFSKVKTDWVLWVDTDDIVYQPGKLRDLIHDAAPEIGALWCPYHYATDELGNVTTVYERERLLRMKYQWIWRGRLHETTQPLIPCKMARTDDFIIKHNHLGGAPRHERNFKLLEIMQTENPEDKRVRLYLGHQNFAAQNWIESAKYYMGFGSDSGAMDLERYQALCYCSKAMRQMDDPQAVDVALMAVELFPNYIDAYLELAHSYKMVGALEKALHWSYIADTKERITQPPPLIFINPLDLTFNKFGLRAECYSRLGKFDEALLALQQCYQIRLVPEIMEQIQRVQEAQYRNRVVDSVKVLAVDLLRSREITKLSNFLEVVPFWFKDTPDYRQLEAGAKQYVSQIISIPKTAEVAKDAVEVEVSQVDNVPLLLEELEKTYQHIKLRCVLPMPDSKQITAMSLTDMKRLLMAKEGRHIVNLRRTETEVWGEYDYKVPDDLSIRIYCGQGLEHWNMDTIQKVGCGGSETAMAFLAKHLAQKNCQPIVYAMDDQVWDGVIYSSHESYNPLSIASNLFISSRVPDLFNTPIPATQKWLWFHDIHRWDRFTPDIASEIDCLVVLSQWHANFTKATYPFMQDAEVLDLDNNELTYHDCVATEKWYTDDKARKLPKMAIIGNGIDTSRFANLTEKRIPHRFIWASSPDRGLEQVLQMWGALKKRLPDATLKIFYGWEYYNNMLKIPAYREFKQKILQLIRQDGVEWCGRIGQLELAKEYMKADALIYPPPHDFRETYGIAFLEAQAAGCLCFYRQNGALGETIGKRGIPLSLDYLPENMIDIVDKTLNDRHMAESLRQAGREYAMGRDWAVQADKVLSLYRRLESGQNNGSNR